MAGYGPPPAENKRRRNADSFADHKATVVDDGQIVGPPLEGADWSAHARAYWDTWRSSPQAKAFLATDWMRLRMLVPLVESYLSSPTPVKLAEIRQNESLLGATHTDRLRARIRVEKPAEGAPPPAGVTALDEYRKSLAG